MKRAFHGFMFLILLSFLTGIIVILLPRELRKKGKSLVGDYPDSSSFRNAIYTRRIFRKIDISHCIILSNQLLDYPS